MFYKNTRFRERIRTENSTFLSSLPPLPRSWTHNVFPSFHGADVRKSFLSHFLKECKSKGINPFIDNEITRGEFIGPELKKAIRGSRIAIVLLSKRYASSSWYLDELVEIMKCNEVLGYTVMVIFYEVDPSDVKKQTGEFGKVFKKTCKGKTKEITGRWSQALAEVATIAGYHSSNSENDVKLIEKIVTDVSDKLFSSTRSRDFDGFVGIGAHMEKMEKSDYRYNTRSKSFEGTWDQSRLQAGFEKLAWEITALAGQLPLGLRVIGSSFRGKSKQQSTMPYTFPDFRQGLDVLVDKSLITIFSGYLEINSSLVQLGREIARKKYGSEPEIRKPGKRRFLVDATDICKVLSNDTTDSSSVIGVKLTLRKTDDELYTSERAFERMTDLQFLRINEWYNFPMKCLPFNYNPMLLVHLNMKSSKLEKLWDGSKPLTNLKEMDLRNSRNLKELPDLSTATNLQELFLADCSSLVKFPSSIGNATKLKTLSLDRCSSLMELPSSIGNLKSIEELILDCCSSLVALPSSLGNSTNLMQLSLTKCSNLVELPSSIGNLHKLQQLCMEGCSKLKVIPMNINMESLENLNLSNCPLLKTFPELSTNISILKLIGTPVKEVPLAISSWSRLEELQMSYSDNLKESPHAFDSITVLHLTDDAGIQELGPWVKGCSRLRQLLLNGMQKLVSLPQLPDSLKVLDAENCVSLERLDFSFRSPDICLNFRNCFKLNQEARDLIIQASIHRASVFPGGEVPAYFSDRATGGTLTVKLNERPPNKSVRFKTTKPPSTSRCTGAFVHL
ncbi:hypothetical protein AALP_AA8G314200 [Arabis alpina]|uniref:TIR domain-containing protein n=1 Tax=Arabis alpina TaxID=50452 RepID=A0A087GAP4_ARAAL|nr:hypothetical protein AALP_AA8G314200 [Arabis alpina]